MQRQKKEKDIDCTNEEQVLDQLDLGDYGLLIMSCPCDFGLNNDKVKVFKVYMDKIVPIRNRVMHTKPLELGNRALLRSLPTDQPEGGCAKGIQSAHISQSSLTGI